MANVLYINSSVRSTGSLSRQLSAEFIAKWQASHPADTIVERDLAANPVPHLTEEMLGAFFTAPEQRNAVQAHTVKLSDTLVDEVLAADVIVIGAPMYNFGITVQLKSWFDAIARAGVTFKYGPNGPVGLLTGKKVYVAVTRGGLHKDAPTDTQLPHLKLFLSFVGLTDVQFVFSEGHGLGADAVARARAAADEQIDAVLAAEPAALAA